MLKRTVVALAVVAALAGCANAKFAVAFSWSTDDLAADIGITKRAGK